MYHRIIKYVFITIATVCRLPVSAQDGYPVPPTGAGHLFYMQHSQNYNTYVYTANVEHGEISDDDPLDIYRLVYTEGGKRMPLNSLQRKLAYGVKATLISHNFYELKLAASKKQPFYLFLDEGGKPRVDVTVNNRKMYLDRIFLKIKEGSSELNVKVAHALFTGRDFVTGQVVTEKVLPGE